LATTDFWYKCMAFPTAFPREMGIGHMYNCENQGGNQQSNPAVHRKHQVAQDVTPKEQLFEESYRDEQNKGKEDAVDIRIDTIPINFPKYKQQEETSRNHCNTQPETCLGLFPEILHAEAKASEAFPVNPTPEDTYNSNRSGQHKQFENCGLEGRWCHLLGHFNTKDQ